MDTFDSYRPNVPARLPASRPGAAALRSHALAPAEASASTLSVQVALRGARRYWWLVLLLTVVGSSAVGIGVYMKVKPSYEASSTLRVDPGSGDLLGIKTSAEVLGPYLQTQVRLMTSSNVLIAAASDPGLANLERIRTAGDISQELRKVLIVGVIPDTYLIQVSMISPDSIEAAKIVNAVVDAFLKANTEWTDGMTNAQIRTLEVYLADLQVKTEDLERQWKEIAAKGNSDIRTVLGKDSTDGKESQSVSNVTLDEFKQVRNQMLAVELQLAESQALVDQLKAEIAAPKLAPRVDEERVRQQITRRFQSDPEVVKHAEAMMLARDKIEEVRRIANLSGDPAERAALQKLTKLEQQYEKLWEIKSRLIRDEIELGSRPVDPEQELREATARVRALTAKKEALKQKSDQLEVRSVQDATDGVRVSLIIDHRGTIRNIEDAVNRRLEQLRFEAKGQNRIRKVTMAMPSSKPISDKRLTYLAMTPVGVLGTVLCLVVLLEVRAGRVADPEVLSSRVRHEVFSIAPLPNLRPGDENDVRAEQRLARFVQSLDHLRVALCEHGPTGEGRCIMITSATGGEGKTTLAAHLAARCANAGTSTLLIDADLRRASLGRLLDVPIGSGLGDVLGGDADLDEALITVQAGGFHFLSAGTPGRDPSRVLKSARFAELIARLRRTYDLVIIDTPPVLPVADALIMGRWVDGAVMTARFDASRLPLVERANRQLAVAGIPILGVVVNGVRGTETTYGNYTYTYNHYGNGTADVDAPTV
jgi:capsular exopolysaccharide synthesis family protein